MYYSHNSHDFNGIHIADLGEDFEKVKLELIKLLESENIVINFGDRHPNPHILAFEPEPIEEQIEKLKNLKLPAPE